MFKGTTVKKMILTAVIVLVGFPDATIAEDAIDAKELANNVTKFENMTKCSAFYSVTAVLQQGDKRNVIVKRAELYVSSAKVLANELNLTNDIIRSSFNKYLKTFQTIIFKGSSSGIVEFQTAAEDLLATLNQKCGNEGSYYKIAMAALKAAGN